MPPITRAAKKRAAGCVRALWDTPNTALVEAVQHENAKARAVNTADPITMEEVAGMDPDKLFVHELASGGCHVYDCGALFDYVESTAVAVSPLTRTEFSEDELRRLSVQNGKHKNYLVAVVQFARWRPFLPSPTMMTNSYIDTLWTYMELLVLLSNEPNALEFCQMCQLLLFPWIGLTLLKIQQEGEHSAARVLASLSPRLLDMRPGEFRQYVFKFFKRVRKQFIEGT